MGAVQNAMLRDGLDPAIMDLDPNKSVASQMEIKQEDGPTLKDDPKYQKYFRVRYSPNALLFQLFSYSDSSVLITKIINYCSISRC